MRRWIIPVVLLAVCLSMFPFLSKGRDGMYNHISRLAYCTTRTACIHEIGHALDQRAGWISQSTEFYKAVQMYLVVELKKPAVQELPMCILELTYRSEEYSIPMKKELYAYLFQQAEGDMNRVPESLRSFYDWDAAGKLMQTLSESQRLYWMGSPGGE